MNTSRKKDYRASRLIGSAVTFICLVLVVATFTIHACIAYPPPVPTPAPSEKSAARKQPPPTWQQLRHDGISALGERNYWEATNKLKGALLVAMDAHASEADCKSILQNLQRAYNMQGKAKQAKVFSAMSSPELRRKLQQEYKPNVWFDREGLPRNNVVPKEKILGEVQMLKNGDLKVEIRARMDYPAFCGHGQAEIKKGDPEYDAFLEHLGGIEPGGNAALLPWKKTELDELSAPLRAEFKPFAYQNGK